jgi:hypothetical protein
LPRDTLLNVLHRFTRKVPGAWEKVEATFDLARALRSGERDNDEHVKEVGLLVDICEAAAPALMATARVVTEKPR